MALSCKILVAPLVIAKSKRSADVTIRWALMSSACLATALMWSVTLSMPTQAQGGAASAANSAGGVDSVSGTGGNGASDFSSGSSSQYRGGGGGGAGVAGGAGGRGYNNGAAAANGGATAGASGADGAAGGANAGNGGGGGAHGFSGVLTAGVSSGGNGGNGGSSDGSGGGGGAGAYGAVISGNGTLSNPITGGNGGNGGTGFTMGSGGSGGIGLLVQGSTSLTVQATVTGGSGGFTQDGNGIFGAGGSGGAGGTGIDVRSSGLVLTNDGSIRGGDGRIGGNGGGGIAGGPPGTGPRYSGTDGAGGAGITGADLTIINNGSITGGQGYVNRASTSANAVTFTGGVNALAVTASSIINGRVDAFSTADTFGLGGAVDASFNIGSLGAAASTTAQYRGFGVLEKSGASTWTVTGTPSASLAYRITDGALDLNGGTQSATSLRLTGGTLQNGTINSTGAFDLRSGTISANLAGSGSLIKSTNDTVILSGTNAYSGTTTISAGIIEVNSSAALGDGSATNSLIFDGGTLRATDAVTSPTTRSVQMLGNGAIDTNGNAVQIAGVISGTGALSKAGSGTLTLSGANTSYSGAITISAGTLAVTGAGALASTAITTASGAIFSTDGGALAAAAQISNDGTLALTGSESIAAITASPGAITLSTGAILTMNAGASSVAGVISGAGGLTIAGTSASLLLGANTYTGSTTLTGGSLAVTGVGTLASTAITTAAGSMLSTDGGALSADAQIANAGSLTLSGSESVASINGAGTIALNGVGTELALASGSDISGIISGIGALTLTDGTTRLSGLNTYSGVTSVNAGTLVVDGSIASSTLTVINAGARLMGIGTLGNTMLASGSIFAPGNSVGTLNVSGNLGVSAGSIYDVEISPSDSDRVAVTGTATLNGGIVRVNSAAAASQFSNGPSNFTILTATGGVIGTFDTLDTSALTFFDGTLDYSNINAVQLLLTRNDLDLAGVAVTANQSGTAQGIQSLGSNNPIYAAILTMSPDEALAAYDQLSGEPHASVERALGSSGLASLGLMSNRLGQSPGGDRVLSMVDTGEGPVDKSTPTNVLWGDFYGNFGKLAGASGAADMQSSAGGIVLGADGLLGDWRLGALLSAGRTNVSVHDRASTTDADDFGVGLYGGTSFGQANFKFALSHIYHDVRSSRTVTVPGLASVLEAVYRATTTQGYGELGYSLDLGPAQIEPYAQLGVVHQSRDGFTETGGLVALSSAATQSTSAYASLGIRGSMQFALEGKASVKVSGGVAYRHDFGGATQTVNNFVGGAAFTVSGAEPTTDALLLETAVSYEFNQDMSVSLSYSGAFGNAGANHTVQAGLAIAF